MHAIVYVALAKGDQVAGYQARFVDVPDCTVVAASPGELLAHARAALGAALQGLADDGQEWPAATPIERAPAQPPEFPLLVDVEVEDPPVRVNISLGEQLLKRLDAAAAESGATRSGYIAQAVRARLGDRRTTAADFEGVARRLQGELAAVGRRLGENIGPDSAFNRSLAELDDRISDTIRKAADNVSAAMAKRREAEGRERPPPAKPAPTDEAADI
jgi:predicted RNase H-like HicB family nuclease